MAEITIRQATGADDVGATRALMRRYVGAPGSPEWR